MKYVCPVCGYIYDEEKEGVLFSALPDSWVCPLCGARKEVFAPEMTPELPKEPKAPVHMDHEMKQLSAAELSVVCSNLARGCEKQYNTQAQELYLKLADYFSEITPDVPDAEPEMLAGLIRENLEHDYPVVKETAEKANDRGVQRICVWGEKVTRILETLLFRYEKEGEAFLANTNVWVCTICGFIYVGDEAPKLCPVCKVPDWKFEKEEGRHAV